MPLLETQTKPLEELGLEFELGSVQIEDSTAYKEEIYKRFPETKEEGQTRVLENVKVI